MALAYKYHSEHNLIVLVGLGILDATDFKDFITEFLVKHPGIKTGYLELCDLRGIEANRITFENTREIVQLERKYHDRPIASKFAFVVRRDIELGEVRQYDAHSDIQEREIEVFFDIDEAKRWLGIEELKDELFQCP